jgi:hypothetical protein
VTDRELDKNAARRLAIIRHAREVTGNVALTCRYYGISGRRRGRAAAPLAGMASLSPATASMPRASRRHHASIRCGQPARIAQFGVRPRRTGITDAGAQNEHWGHQPIASLRAQ